MSVICEAHSIGSFEYSPQHILMPHMMNLLIESQAVLLFYSLLIFTLFIF